MSQYTYCAFCGKNEEEVRLIFSNSITAICSDCIIRYAKIIFEKFSNEKNKEKK